MITLKFKKIHENAKLPTKKNPTDAGWDLYAIDNYRIYAKSQQIIHTGIELAGVEAALGFPVYAMESNSKYPSAIGVLADFYVVLHIWPRGGLDAKHGLHTGAGVIDQDYRGEILVLLKNTSDIDYYVRFDEKVAQLVPVLTPRTEVIEVAEHTEETLRGSKGGITEEVTLENLIYGPIRKKEWVTNEHN